MTPTISERVDAGVAWLDEHYPGWASSIDPEKLDLLSGCRCVLGQLAIDLDYVDDWAHSSAYWHIADRGEGLVGWDSPAPHRLDNDQAWQLGFNTGTNTVDRDGFAGEGSYLTAEWRTRLTQ